MSRVWLLAAVSLAACEVPTGLPIVETRFRFEVDDVEVPVAGVPSSASAEQSFSDFDVARDVQSATVWVTPVNPSNAQGTLTVRISGGGVTVTGTVNVAGGPDQPIHMSREEVQALLSGDVTIEASGTLCRSTGCGLAPPPFPMVTLENELEVVVALGGEG